MCIPGLPNVTNLKEKSVIISWLLLHHTNVQEALNCDPSVGSLVFLLQRNKVQIVSSRLQMYSRTEQCNVAELKLNTWCLTGCDDIMDEISVSRTFWRFMIVTWQLCIVEFDFYSSDVYISIPLMAIVFKTTTVRII